MTYYSPLEKNGLQVGIFCSLFQLCPHKVATFDVLQLGGNRKKWWTRMGSFDRITYRLLGNKLLPPPFGKSMKELFDRFQIGSCALKTSK